MNGLPTVWLWWVWSCKLRGFISRVPVRMGISTLMGPNRVGTGMTPEWVLGTSG